MGVQWTKEQQQVISLRNRNILVSAAAGSGKTAVLVERIITRLTRDANPLNVDEMLIVTYTEAAASEMKERIRDAIERELMEQPENVHLQRQETLIHNAMITTIHSFCLAVIREYFHKIDLDPGFRIAEEGELKLLRQDVLRELLERHYADGDEQFLAFAESYAAGRSDQKLEELILQLYEFSRSYPDADEWLEDCLDLYRISDADAMEEKPYVRRILSQTVRIAQDMEELLRYALAVCNSEEGPYMYSPMIESDLDVIRSLQKSGSFSEAYQTVLNIKWAVLSRKKDTEVSDEKRETVKAVRDEVKELVKQLKGQYFYAPQEELSEDLGNAFPLMETLKMLTGEFAAALEREKKSKNLIDFGDMEHFALQILARKENGVWIPTEAAAGYQEQFAEVMIDEYQDSNLIQETILTSVSRIHSGFYNIFMVGDVKQSIYRFRLSRPELFMEKFDTYSLTDGEKQRIDLHRNFRSRREVLDSTNFVFRQIMQKSLGGISYDREAALYPGAAFEEMAGNETEVLLLETGKETLDEDVQVEETNRELEARMTAGRIKELVGNHLVLDRKTGTYRPAGYGDIVILTRSLKGWTDVFMQILNREGVPAYSSMKEGYFETQEISILLDYLKILDNFRQDIPLAAVMLSYLGGFTEEETAQIRNLGPEKPFYMTVEELQADDLADEKLSGKMEKFFDRIRHYRAMVPYTSIHDLLWKIIHETGYGNYVSAMPGGIQRRANLDMLIEKAMTFETTSYKGLFHFIRYINQLQKAEVDYGEASTLSDQAEAVRLISIHKSKGLEFPIVFVAGLGKKFNTQDSRSTVALHPEAGIGLDCIDLKRRTKAPTILKKVIQREITLENLGEELRILYVAMTRAKEKLILTGTTDSLEKKLKKFASVCDRGDEPLSFSMLTGASCYLDWVLPALMRSRAAADLLSDAQLSVPFTHPLYREEVPVRMIKLSLSDLVSDEASEEIQSRIRRDNLLLLGESGQEFSGEMKDILEKQFSYRYPYEAEQLQKMKFTVSELKKRQFPETEAGEILYEEPETVPLIPKFLREDEPLQGAGRGTAYHRLMELLDVTKDYTADTLEAEMDKYVQEGRLAPEMKLSIRVGDILHFLGTTSGQRMKECGLNGRLHREQPFVIGIPASEVYPEHPEEESDIVLVQGIIDTWMEENGEITVLDYKTDRVDTPAELTERYGMQLDYYAQALRQVTGKPVRQKLIYSFTLRKEIEVH